MFLSPNKPFWPVYRQSTGGLGGLGPPRQCRSGAPTYNQTEELQEELMVVGNVKPFSDLNGLRAMSDLAALGATVYGSWRCTPVSRRRNRKLGGRVLQMTH